MRGPGESRASADPRGGAPTLVRRCFMVPCSSSLGGHAQTYPSAAPGGGSALARRLRLDSGRGTSNHRKRHRLTPPQAGTVAARGLPHQQVSGAIYGRFIRTRFELGGSFTGAAARGAGRRWPGAFGLIPGRGHRSQAAPTPDRGMATRRHCGCALWRNRHLPSEVIPGTSQSPDRGAVWRSRGGFASIPREGTHVRPAYNQRSPA